MSDSSVRDELDAKHERDAEQRLEAIKRWVRHIETAPPEQWGEELNSLVNAQVEAARMADLDAEHYQRMNETARELDDPTD